jgi:hypothetical protein
VHHCGAAQQTLVHPVLDFLAATPDGLTADRVVETKAPWRSLYTSIDERPDYAAQLQLQMEVSGLDRADLVIWRQGQPLLVSTVERDPAWLAGVLPTVEKFLDDYRAVLADPERHTPHREPLRDERTDPDWAAAAAAWLELDYLIRQLEASRDKAAATLGAGQVGPGLRYRPAALRAPRGGAVQAGPRGPEGHCRPGEVPRQICRRHHHSPYRRQTVRSES